MKKTLKSGDGIHTPLDGETVHSKDSFAFWYDCIFIVI
jgi:hypothetical protein